MSYLGRSAKLSLKAQEKVSFLATAGQTSKTGLSYVPNFVEVYVNGILLTDTTDFTATNGNSVTFTVALALNDEVTVISLKTFSVADHYTKSDANTLLAAKAPLASPTFTGTTTHNRTGSDGTIVDLQKDGTTVGSIYSAGGSQFGIESEGALTFGQNSGTAKNLYFSNTTLSTFDGSQDGTVDLGRSNARWKDAYLSGGVYLGGTGSANKLDDYEEGTWTPSFISVNSTSPTGSFAHAGTYTKIGRAVTICCYMQVNSVSVGGGTLAIAGMPFASIDVNGKRGACSLLASTWDNARTEHIGVGIYDSTRLGFLTSSHDAGWNWEQTGSLNAGTNMRFTMTYFTP